MSNRSIIVGIRACGWSTKLLKLVELAHNQDVHGLFYDFLMPGYHRCYRCYRLVALS